MSRSFYYSLIACLLFFISCDKKDPQPQASNFNLNPEEVFEDTDEPELFTFDDKTFNSPWGYNKVENASRKYPLLVSGMWGEGESQYAKVAKDYPAFVIDYQMKSEYDGQQLAIWINNAIENGYRIDKDRVYLTGFSYGGSSSYPLAKGMFAEGMPFAAVIRVAGQSKSDLGNDVAEQTAVWYHIGLEDDAIRVDVARDALEYMQNYECNNSAKQTKAYNDITGYERTTVTLTRSGFEMFKYSEYVGMGHSPGACYKDEALFYWLFNHSLAIR